MRCITCITLDTELTPAGIVCSHPVLGQVATIRREIAPNVPTRWVVDPYTFPIYERSAKWASLQAAEFYALALAYEMQEQGART